MDWNALAPWALLPLAGAVIGWVTNALAIRMLFRPRRRIGVGPFGIQGVFPKRRYRLSEQMGQVVEENLIGPEDVQAVLAAPGFRSAFDAMLERRIAAFVDDRAEQLHPVLRLWMTRRRRGRFKRILREELDAALPELLRTAAREMENHLEVRHVVQTKLDALDETEIESVLLSVLGKELRTLEALGALLGGVVGLAEAALLSVLPVT